MSQPKLVYFIIEKFNCEFEPPKISSGKVAIKEKVRTRIKLLISKNKNEKDKFVVKLEISILGTDKKRKLFIFESTVGGLFKRTEDKKSFKSLAKTICKDILYDNLCEHFNNIANHSPYKNIRLPVKI
jgi:preprotein translocase subunit SecB